MTPNDSRHDRQAATSPLGHHGTAGSSTFPRIASTRRERREGRSHVPVTHVGVVDPTATRTAAAGLRRPARSPRRVPNP